MKQRQEQKATKTPRRPPHTSLSIGDRKRSLGVQELLSAAFKHYHAGRLHQAESMCQQILEIQVDNADALYVLGRIAFQRGKDNIAVEYISKAISVNGTNAAFHNDLGTALTAQGRLDEAIASYQQALAIMPDQADTHYNLGNVLTDQGNMDDAIASYQRALDLKPDYSDAHYNLGNTLRSQGRLDEAIASYRQALVIKPDYTEAHINLGDVLKDQRRLDEAIESYRQAIALEPKQADAHNNLGYALQEQGKLDKAIVSYREALAIRPDYADAHYNLGNAFADQGRLDAAIECYKEALRLKPDYAKAHNNLGNALKGLGKLDMAIESYDKALCLKPDYAQAHLNKALVLLLSGNFEEGWPEYEWRLQIEGIVQQVIQHTSGQTRWDGLSLAGKNIRVLSEQGLGDVIHFVRYLPLVKARGGRVIFQCQRELVSLLDGFSGIDMLLEESDNGCPDVACDVYIPLLSLPGIFGTAVDTIPAEVPYIKTDPLRTKSWNSRLDCQDFKIGLAWRGNPKYKNDRKRSCPLTAFSPLAHMPGVTFYSLQKGSAGEQVSHPPEGLTLIDFGDKLEDFAETAALISNLDLVISVDTAIAHLAGAMARPVWTILPFDPDWRWLLGREDNPWYPTMRLFRQPKPGDWDAVIRDVARELAKLVYPN